MILYLVIKLFGHIHPSQASKLYMCLQTLFMTFQKILIACRLQTRGGICFRKVIHHIDH